MPAELDTLLHRTASTPAHPLDVVALLGRARQRQRRVRLLAGTGALALVAVVAAGVALPRPTTVVFDQSQTAEADPPQPSIPTPLPGRSGQDSPMLPPAPIEGRSGAVAVWTGQEVLVWGGWLDAEMGTHPDQVEMGELYTEDGADPVPIGTVYFDDGAAYDPASQEWRTIAAAPFSGSDSYEDLGVWTGEELLVWSSAEDRLVAYDPEADEWEILPDPPDPPEPAGRPVVTLVWTGTEAIVWGGMDHQPELPALGAAFDPATRAWRVLPEAPVPPRQWHTATWTGQEMIVWGGSTLVGERNAELGGAAYDPAADTWRPLPPAPIGGRQGHTATWTGTELLVWGDGAEGLAYDPAEDAWRVFPDAPVRAGGKAVAAWTGEGLLVWGAPIAFAGDGPDLAFYDPAEDRWEALAPSGLSERCRAATAWTGEALFAWSGLPDCEIGLPPDDGAMLEVRRLPLSQRDEDGASEEPLPEGCRVLPPAEEGERRVSGNGLVGAPLGPTLVVGVHHGYELGPLAAVEADDPDFASPWQVVAAVVTDISGRQLGTATWLSPNAIAAYAGGAAPEDVDAWRQDPTADPSATHLYAADDLAEQVSVWTRTQQRASTIDDARACAVLLSAR